MEMDTYLFLFVEKLHIYYTLQMGICDLLFLILKMYKKNYVKYFTYWEMDASVDCRPFITFVFICIFYIYILFWIIILKLQIVVVHKVFLYHAIKVCAASSF